MANLASTYSDQGRWKAAEELQLQVREISKKRIGAEHSSTLTSMANRAPTYSGQERSKEAEELELQVQEISKKRPEAENPSTSN